MSTDSFVPLTAAMGDKRLRSNIDRPALTKYATAEAFAGATWARREPDGAISVNVAEAVRVGFAVTP